MSIVSSFQPVPGRRAGGQPLAAPADRRHLALPVAAAHRAAGGHRLGAAGPAASGTTGPERGGALAVRAPPARPRPGALVARAQPDPDGPHPLDPRPDSELLGRLVWALEDAAVRDRQGQDPVLDAPPQPAEDTEAEPSPAHTARACWPSATAGGPPTAGWGRRPRSWRRRPAGCSTSPGTTATRRSGGRSASTASRCCHPAALHQRLGGPGAARVRRRPAHERIRSAIGDLYVDIGTASGTGTCPAAAHPPPRLGNPGRAAGPGGLRAPGEPVLGPALHSDSSRSSLAAMAAGSNGGLL